MRPPPPIAPGPGQESVWDYPRPPRLEPSAGRIVVEIGGRVLADTSRSLRVLETSQPPAYYLPPDDIEVDLLAPSPTRTLCEWKGVASYVSVVVDGRRVVDAGWTYPAPAPAFAALRGYIAFYARAMDRCTVDGEVVDPNEGSFYGGWITSKVVGPFKGGAGSAGW